MGKNKDMLINKMRRPISVSEQYPVLYKPTKDSDWIKWEWGILNADHMIEYEKLGKGFKNNGLRMDLFYLIPEMGVFIVIAYALRFEEPFYYKTNLIDTYTFKEGWSLSDKEE